MQKKNEIPVDGKKYLLPFKVNSCGREMSMHAEVKFYATGVFLRCHELPKLFRFGVTLDDAIQKLGEDIRDHTCDFLEKNKHDLPKYCLEPLPSPEFGGTDTEGKIN